MAKLPTVRDHMDTRSLTLRPHMPILDAVDFLLENHITGAPVVNDDGNLVGLLSEKDCLRLIARGVDAEMPKGSVGDYMSTELSTIEPEMNIYFAAGVFLSHTMRRLPVVENGKLVGVITRFDILRAIQTSRHS
jgi:predicted transcriptional regulator